MVATNSNNYDRELPSRTLLLGGLCPVQVPLSREDSKGSLMDRRFYMLQNHALSWTWLDMGTDVWYLLLMCGALLDGGDQIEIFGEEEVQIAHYIPVFLYLFLSILAGLGVFLLKHKDYSFFPLSIVKGILFLMSATILGMVVGIPFSKDFWGAYWAPIVFVLSIYNSVKGFAIWAHFTFHGFVIRIGLEEHLTRNRNRAIAPPSIRQLKDVENPIENFYHLKTAQLNHALMMKQNNAQLEETNARDDVSWMENFYEESEDTEEDDGGEEEEAAVGGRIDGAENKHKVWTLSDGKDKFLTRSVALDGEKCTIYDVQISL